MWRQAPRMQPSEKSSGQGESEDTSACASLFETDAISFLEDRSLGAEVFGPSTLLIRYSSRDQLIDCARSLEGQLTATIHADDGGKVAA